MCAARFRPSKSEASQQKSKEEMYVSGIRHTRNMTRDTTIHRRVRSPYEVYNIPRNSCHCCSCFATRSNYSNCCTYRVQKTKPTVLYLPLVRCASNMPARSQTAEAPCLAQYVYRHTTVNIRSDLHTPRGIRTQHYLWHSLSRFQS